MSDRYGCADCGFTGDIDTLPVQCPICGHVSMEKLRWTKGGDGSHWEGCDDVHWDCKIAKLEAENVTLKDATKTFTGIYDARVSALEAENKRLTGVLEQIANNKWRTEKGLIEYARTALEQK